MVLPCKSTHTGVRIGVYSYDVESLLPQPPDRVPPGYSASPPRPCPPPGDPLRTVPTLPTAGKSPPGPRVGDCVIDIPPEHLDWKRRIVKTFMRIYGKHELVV